MLKILNVLCILGALMLLRPIESGGFYNYDNDVYDSYRQESSNQDIMKTSMTYECKSEGFHQDYNDCRIFYRCVEWGNGSPLTPFKFECGIGTVFSPSKGNICVHPNDSDRPECCEPNNEIDSNESSSSHSWSQELELGYPFHNPSPPKNPSQTQQFYYSSYPSHTQKPQYPNYPSQTQKPQQLSSVPQTQTSDSNYPLPAKVTESHQPTYPSNLDLPEVSQCSGLKGVSCTSSSECTKEGFFSNPKDCHKFYRCVIENSSLKRYDFTCGTGTAWDQTIQTCNHENSVADCSFDHKIQNQSRTPAFVSPTAGTRTSFKPTTAQTSQLPWSNSNSHGMTSMDISYPLPQSIENPTNPSYLPPKITQYPTQSPYPQYSTHSAHLTSPLIHRPVYAMQSSFQSTNRPEYIPPQLTTINISSSNNSNNEIDVLNTGGKPCASTGSVKDCKEQGFFSNPKDCHKFFRCVYENGSFQKYDFECGIGTAWNQQLQTCNYINTITGCGTSESATNLPDSGFTSVNQTPDTDIESGNDKPISNSLTLKPITSQSSYSTLKPNINKTQTTSHFNTMPIIQSVSEVTQSPSTSNIQNTENSEISNHQQTQKPTIEQHINPQVTQSISSSSNNNPQNFSNDTCQSEGFFANLNECQKFYRCISHPPGYIKYDFDCAPGTAWDQTLLTCNYIALITTCNLEQNVVKPTQSVSIDRPLTSPSSESSSVTQTSAEKKPDPINSSQFTTSIKPSLETFNSTEGSLMISSTLSTTTTENNFEQSTKSDCFTPKFNDTIVCNNAGFYPHPIYCNKFYRCVDNGKGFNVYYFDCPVGTIFDPSIEVCNYAESVYPVRNCRIDESQSGSSSQSQSSTTQRITNVETTAESQNFTTSIASEITPEPPSIGTVITDPSVSDITQSSSTSMILTSASTTLNSESTTLSSESTTLSSESTTLSSESTTLNSEATSSNSEVTNPSSTAISSESQATIPSSEATTISSEPTTISSDTTTTNSDATTISSEATTISSEATTISSEATTISSEATTISSEATTISSEATTISSEATTISSEATTISSEATTISSEATTLNSNGTTSEITSSEANTSGSETTASNLATTLGGTATTTTVPLTSIEMTTNGNSESTISITDTSSQSTTNMPTQETTSVSLSTINSQESTTIISNEKPAVADKCPTLTNLTDDQIVLVCPTGFRRHPKLCNLFYQCTMSGNTEIKILILKCPEGTIFDEKTNKCLLESESSQPCKETVTGKRIQRGVSTEFTSLIEVSKNPLCPDEGHFPYRDGCSNIFYKCGRNSRYDLEGYLFKCPKYFVYWSVSRRCERASRLPTCTKMSNEIENENENWKNRWEIPVEDRNLSARSLFHY